MDYSSVSPTIVRFRWFDGSSLDFLTDGADEGEGGDGEGVCIGAERGGVGDCFES